MLYPHCSICGTTTEGESMCEYCIKEMEFHHMLSTRVCPVCGDTLVCSPNEAADMLVCPTCEFVTSSY